MAEENKIPVIFSSMGINNMDATPESEQKLKDLLKRKCIAAVSVRENSELFKQYAKESNNDFEVEQVCDPAVWTKYIYRSNIKRVKKDSKSQSIIGINVVRGGLFKDNNKPWRLSDEIAYLNELKKILDENGLEYKFYTNGSFLDNNTLHYYARENNIPENQLVFPKSTREFVETVALFDSVIAIRMHSSIVSYALEIPSVNLIWNDKIPLFYKNINYPERAVDLEQWNANDIFSAVQEWKKDDNYKHDENYLMSLYRYLYKVISKLFTGEFQENNIFDFNRVKAELERQTVSVDEDIDDFQLKIEKSEKHYLSRFIELKQKDKDIKALKKELEKKNKEITKLKTELNNINGMPAVRISKKIKRIARRAKNSERVHIKIASKIIAR